jgi:hypothetical protein
MYHGSVRPPIPSCCFTLPLVADSTYFWRVGAVDSASDLVFSGSRSFRTGILPAFSADSLAFPATRIGDSTAAFVILKNRMPVPLLVDSIRTRSGRFSCTPNRTVIRRADTAAVTVRFFPDRSGTFVDTILVFNNSWVSPFRVPVEGFAPPLASFAGQDPTRRLRDAQPRSIDAGGAGVRTVSESSESLQ